MRERTTGNAYTPDADYSPLRGRVVTHHEVVGITLDGWKVRHQVTVIDFAKPEPVKPVDPDVVIADEPRQAQDMAEFAKVGLAARLRHAEARQTTLEGELIAYLECYGPAHVALMARDLGQAKSTVERFFRRHDGTVFCQVETCGRGGAVLWGLVGIHDQQEAA